MLRAQPIFFDRYATNMGDATTSLGGTAVSLGASNVKGTWANVISTPLPFDTYLLNLWINSSSIAATDTSALLDIGIDKAGGTSYSVLVPNLSVGWIAAGFVASKKWRFPLFIPAGSTLGIRGQVATVSAKTVQTLLLGFGATREPSNLWCGTSVTAYGVDTGTSLATPVVPGTAPSWGTWTNVGSVLSKDHYAFLFDITGNADVTLDANGISLEIGAGGVAYSRHYSLVASSEYHTEFFPDSILCRHVPAGTQMQARIMTAVPGEAMNIGIWGIS